MPLINGAQTSNVFGSTLTDGTGSVSKSKGLGREDFFMLLIAELKNQDPLNPKDDSTFIAELAQFSALEETRKLTEVNSQMQAFQATTQSASLIGRNVEAIIPDLLTGGMTTWSGEVSEVVLGGPMPTLIVDGVEVEFSSVSRVF